MHFLFFYSFKLSYFSVKSRFCTTGNTKIGFYFYGNDTTVVPFLLRYWQRGEKTEASVLNGFPDKTMSCVENVLSHKCTKTVFRFVRDPKCPSRTGTNKSRYVRLIDFLLDFIRSDAAYAEKLTSVMSDEGRAIKLSRRSRMVGGTARAAESNTCSS